MGSFGAGLTRFLKGRRIKVSEVIRPKRRDQYRAGKSDPISMPRRRLALYLRAPQPASLRKR
jgi:hypothetical protein